MLLLFTAITLVVVGLLVLRWTWRTSRTLRVGDHPHCARCNHDLHGLPAESGRCTECGAPLDVPGAVITGRALRDPRRVATGVAVAVMLLSASVLAWRAVDWPTFRLRVTPASRLIADMARGGPAGSDAAFELARRVDAGRYDGEQLLAIARAFRPVVVRARPTGVAGEELPVQIIVTPPAVSISSAEERLTPRHVVYGRYVGHQLGDGPWVDSEDRLNRGHGLRDIDADHRQFPLPAKLPPGATALRLKYEFVLIRLDDLPEGQRGKMDDGGMYYWMPEYRKDYPVAYAWEREVTVPFIVLPTGSTDLTLVASATSRPAMLSSMQIATLPQASFRDPKTRGVRITRESSGFVDVDFGIEFTGLPVAVAFDAFLRDPGSGREAPLGRVVANVGRRGTTGVRNSGEDAAPLADWPAGTAEVVLRPSPEAAKRTPDLQQIWGEDVVIKNVPVLRVEPQTQPAG